MSDKDNRDELIGFKDFIEGKSSHKYKSPQINDKKNGSFELLSFLETESIRLEKEKSFFEEKVYLMKNFNPYKKLNTQIQEEISENEKALYQMLSESDSSLVKSMNEILKQFKRN